jgi:hypothetical protein
MRPDNLKFSPPAEEILDAAVDAQRDTSGQSSLTNCLHALLEAIRLGSLTVVVELGPKSQRALAEAETHLRRLADHFDPPPSDIVDTPYIAHRLGLTTARIAQLVRSGEIPKGCIVPGSGKGRQWKFYRRRMEEWLAKR